MTRKKRISSKKAGEAMQEYALKTLGLSAKVRTRKVSAAEAVVLVKQSVKVLLDTLPSDDACQS